MPLIEVIVPEGSLAPAARESLVKELSAAALKVEGIPDSLQARKLTWVLVSDAPKGTWAVGGEPAAELKFLVRVTVPRGTLSPARRRRMGLTVSKVLSAAAGRPLTPDDAWILVNEIEDGRWTAGGKILTMEDLSTYVGMDAVKKHAKKQGTIGFRSGTPSSPGE
jgi:phenylpyruvate tautomerase PptA (4-oxalocrotonate tautomerase family)